MMIYLRSTLFFLGMCLVTLVLTPVALSVRRLPFERRFAVARAWVNFNFWTLKWICGLRYELRGQENLPAAPFVILSKHQSAWETFAVQVLFPPLVFILKKELLDIPVWGLAMASYEPIAIDRAQKREALKQVLEQGEARLRAGRCVVVFPEGTRVAPGERGRYSSSGGSLAVRAQCPVVPFAHNAGEFWARNAFLKYPGTIQARIGPPIDPAGRSAQAVMQEAEEWIEQQMEEITSSRYRESGRPTTT